MEFFGALVEGVPCRFLPHNETLCSGSSVPNTPASPRVRGPNKSSSVLVLKFILYQNIGHTETPLVIYFS